jgi:hypothetical protein
MQHTRIAVMQCTLQTRAICCEIFHTSHEYLSILFLKPMTKTGMRKCPSSLSGVVTPAVAGARCHRALSSGYSASRPVYYDVTVFSLPFLSFLTIS